MSWFCASSRKKLNNTKIKQSISNSFLSNGQPTYTVALQNFNASVCDELSAQRGQVLEALYTDGEWVYVRNVDSKCGYIPESFCYPLDKVNRNSFQKTTEEMCQPRPRPKTLHLDIAHINYGSQNSVSVHHEVPHRSHDLIKPPHPRTSTPISLLTVTTPPTPNDTLSYPSASPSSKILKRGCNKTFSSNCNKVHDDTSPGVMVRARNTEKSVTDITSRVDTELMMQPNLLVEEAACKVHPVAPTLSGGLLSTPNGHMSRKSTSSSPLIGYQRRHLNRCSSINVYPIHNETLPTHSTDKQPAATTRKSRRVNRRMSMNEERPHCQCTQQMNTHVTPVQRSFSYQEAVLSTEDKLSHIPHARLSSNDCPECSKKNCDCSQPQRLPRTLGKFGSSGVCYDSDDVFWPDTPSKKPYGIYRCRQDYEPKFKGEITLGQNELVIVLDYGKGEWAWIITNDNIEGLIPKHLLVRYDSSRGATEVMKIDVATQTELVVTGSVYQVNNASSTNRGQSADCCLVRDPQLSYQPDKAPKAFETFRSLQTSSSPDWFQVVDSLDRQSHSSDHSTQASAIKFQCQDFNPNGVQVTKTGQAKATQIKTASLTKLKGTGYSQHDTPVLAAAKDYEPPSNSKNCLTIKKGDVLTPQAHMYYPKGWMWVWHNTLKRFGYVPNNYVCYTYSVPRTSRNRKNTIEDAV